MQFFIKITMLVLMCSFVSGGKVKLSQRGNEIIKNLNSEGRADGYSFEYETSFGTTRKERGYFKKNSQGKQFLVTEGEFSYVNENGEVYIVSYIADENGYRSKSPQKMSGKKVLPVVVPQKDVNFKFPDSTKKSGVSTTGRPSSTEDYPFVTTLIPDENNPDLGDRFGPGPALIGSLLG